MSHNDKKPRIYSLLFINSLLVLGTIAVLPFTVSLIPHWRDIPNSLNDYMYVRGPLTVSLTGLVIGIIFIAEGIRLHRRRSRFRKNNN